MGGYSLWFRYLVFKYFKEGVILVTIKINNLGEKNG